MSQLPPSTAATPRLPKPGKVQAIAILCLVDGVLNCVYAPTLFIGITMFGLSAGVASFGICCLPSMCLMVLPAYPVILGILEIIYAIKVLPDAVRAAKPAKYLAVMQIINIVSGDIVSPVVGILSLVFYNDADVKAYFDAVGQQSPNA